VENEAKRQQGLVEMRDELKRRCFSEFTAGITDATPVFKNSDSTIVKGKKIFGMRVPKFAGLMGKELMPHYRFGTELAGIAKEVAGLAGIFHSDELPAYGITEDYVKQAKHLLKVEKDDAFVLVAADEASGRRALNEIAKRCNTAAKGVPKEVRRADGTITRFMRPLPGSARMYPETDEPLVRITKGMLAAITLPPTPEARKKEFEGMGLGPELANQIVKSRVMSEFISLSKEFRSMKPSVIASALLAAPEGLDISPALALVDSNKVAKESLDVIIEGMKGGKNAEEVAKEKGLVMMNNIELRKKIAGIVTANKGTNAGQMMGKAMAELRGKADAQTVKRLIEESLK
jgi:glutamyl-tRNA(Gln) amidotransferase subunit E